MPITIEQTDSLAAIDRHRYEAFHAHSRAPAFYDWRFLDAAECSPLLPAEKNIYLCARDGEDLVGFLPAYLQRLSAVDPLGLLARSAGVRDGGGDLGLFSHMMHCWETTIPCIDGHAGVRVRLAQALARLGEREGAAYAGLLNVCEPALAAGLGAAGLAARPMVDRYRADLARFDSFEHFVRELPTPGRHEMNRQLRKLAASDARVEVLEPPYDDLLERQCALCFATTSRLGTPHYFPAAPLARFVRRCGGLSRLIVAISQGELVGGAICYLQRDTLYVWSAGLTYDRSAFSPYTIFFAEAYRYAFARGIRYIEAGRLNDRIKRRLGLLPSPLHSALARLPPAPHHRSASQAANRPVQDAASPLPG